MHGARVSMCRNGGNLPRRLQAVNSLIVLPEERQGSRAVLLGERAAYVHTFHDLKAGLEVRAAELGGKIGSAKVLTTSSERLELELDLHTPPPPRSPVVLIVAVPRPQTVKKVVQAAAMLGARELILTRAERCVASYLQSKGLAEAALRNETIRGLEQACDSIPPKIQICRSFKKLTDEILPERISETAPPLLIVAHCQNDSTTDLASLNSIEPDREVICALGPEAGWNDFEVDRFFELGFKPMQLGPRMLRVEVAMTYLLGMVGASRARRGSAL